MNGTLYEQLEEVAGVFEQAVVACTLARRVPWSGLKLVQREVEASLWSHTEDDRLQRETNDGELLSSLLMVREDNDGGERLCRLLMLLLLLPIDNECMKELYVTAAPVLVQRCMDAPRLCSATPDLCRQLLSYLLVHPALTHHDQRCYKDARHTAEGAGRALERLRSMLLSPMLPTSDLPDAIMRALHLGTRL